MTAPQRRHHWRYYIRGWRLVEYAIRTCNRSSQPQAFRSVILIIATTLPSLNACSFVSLLHVQTKFFLAVKVFSSCSSRSSPSVIWQTIAFSIGGPMVFDPGCIMTSRIETVLKPGIMDGVSPSYARTTTPGHGVVSL